MRRLQLTYSAVHDLERLRAFIAEHDPAAAARISLRLRTTLQHLLEHPGLGKPVEELSAVRELIAGDYVARYTVTDEAVIVLRIWHGKEDR